MQIEIEDVHSLMESHERITWLYAIKSVLLNNVPDSFNLEETQELDLIRKKIGKLINNAEVQLYEVGRKYRS